MSENTQQAWDDWDPALEDYHSEKNTLALNPDRDPLSTITGQKRIIDTKLGKCDICERFAKYGECADGQYCARLHIAPEAKDKIRELQEKFELNKGRVCMNSTYLTPLELEINPKSFILVSVTNVLKPNHFYLVAPYENKNFDPCTEQEINFYVERVTNYSGAKRKLQKIHDQLASLFDHPYRIDNVNDDIYLSQIVACKLNDGRFRRAMVIKVPDHSNDEFNYTLFLLDVGVHVELPRHQIYDIRADCLSDPALAVNCRLNVKPAGGKLNWTEEAINFFADKARREQYMLCKVVGRLTEDNIYEVDLYNVQTRESLTETMIKSGLADVCSI